MSSYTFQWKGYTGSIKGINGGILETENNGPTAESCILEIVQSDTFRVWKKTIKKEDLDGVIMCNVSQLVLVIQNALDGTSAMKAYIGLREVEMNGNLTMELCLPHLLGTRFVNFVLEEVEQDEVSVLKQRVDFLTAKLNEVKATEKELIQSQARRKFASCGTGLEISRCGSMVSVTSNGGWMTAITEEKMKSGKYYAEFMSLKMLNTYDWYCGIVASAAESLDDALDGLQEGTGYNVNNGNMVENGGNNPVSTGLPVCSGYSGPMIVGVHLNLDENKIQFFLNGKRSTDFDVPAGEYCFAVSLYTQWDAVKLLSIEKE